MSDTRGAVQRLALVLALLCGSAMVDAPARGAPLVAHVWVAFIKHGNVRLMDSTGGEIQTVTTRGRASEGFTSSTYPWYAWSPDHRYLLLVRNRSALPGGSHDDNRQDLLLLDPSGTVLRSLAVGVTADFEPTWAVDGDVVAFATPYTSGNDAEVDAVDVQGHVRALWRHPTTTGNCGSGFGDAEPALLDYWQETGWNGLLPRLQWSLRQHVAIYTNSYCGTNLLVTDTATGSTRPFPFVSPALSPMGIVAAVTNALGADSTGFPLPEVVLADTYGHIIHVVGQGESPTWSPSGRFLYYTQREQREELVVFCCKPSLPRNQLQDIPLRICSTAIWRANADGFQPVRLALQDAFAFGALHVTPSGQSLIFSRIDNDWALWQHRLPGDVLTRSLLHHYPPRVSIQRLDLSGKLVTLVRDAGRPAV